MAVDAVVGGIDFSADKPPRKRRLPVQHVRPRGVPTQNPGLLAPIALGVVLGAVPQGLVSLQTADVGTARKVLGRRKYPRFLEHTGNRPAVFWFGHGCTNSLVADSNTAARISLAGHGREAIFE